MIEHALKQRCVALCRERLEIILKITIIPVNPYRQARTNRSR